jgi:hypothetical protein
MPAVFYPNLMFEEELSGSGELTAAAAGRVAELAPLVGLLCNSLADVVVVSESSVPSGLPESLANVRYRTVDELSTTEALVPGTQFVPWGWSSTARNMARTLQLPDSGPDSVSVQLINSRRFLAEFDRVIPLNEDSVNVLHHSSHEIPLGRVCCSLNQVNECLAEFCLNFGEHWVIKSEFSQAARNRIRGTGPDLTASQSQWVSHRISQGQVVSAEPWLARVAECGLQFRIQQTPGDDADMDAAGSDVPETAIKFDGITELLNDAHGRYIGSVVRFPGNAVWNPAVSRGFRIAEAAADSGYHGFLGIDSMIFQDQRGRKFLRLAHDINGRCTMGRVAQGAMKGLHAGERGLWCRVPAEILKEDQNSFAKKLPESVRTIRTSPERVGHRKVEASFFLLTTNDTDDLDRCIKMVMEHHRSGVN